MKRVVLYIRVSTLEQAQHGFSVDEQKERLISYCKAFGWEVVTIYIDPGYSGSSLERPAIQRLISDIANFDAVIVYKLDRLSRSQKDTLYLIEDILIKNNVDIVSMQENLNTSTPSGRMMIGILSAFAQLERENFKERSMLGRTGRARKGMWIGTGRPPIGYNYNQENQALEINEYEAAQVKMVFDLYLQGTGLMKIARIMHEAGYTHKYGNWLHWGGVTTMLKNSVYAGKVSFNDTDFDGTHAPIISTDTFNKVQEKLSVRQTGKLFKRKSPFSHLLFCANCGAKYFHQPKKNRQGEPTPKYYCYSRYGKPLSFVKDRNCKAKIWDVDKIDSEILRRIGILSSNKEAVNKYLIKTKKQSLNITELEKRIQDIDKKISRIVGLYQLDDMPMEELNKRNRALQDEKNGIASMIASDQNRPATMTVSEIQQSASDIIHDWDNMDIDIKITMLNKLIKKVVISDTALDIYWTFGSAAGD